jgi:hypothetical protein
MKLKYLMLSVFVLICQLGVSQTTRLTSFEELMQSLNSGEQVRVVIHYRLCQWKDTTNHSPVTDAITGMDIDTYEYFAPGAARNKNAFVVFSNSKLIQNPMGKGFVFNYGKVRINDDNTVQVSAKYLHPQNHKELMSEVFVGKLNDGKNGEGVDLFVGR